MEVWQGRSMLKFAAYDYFQSVVDKCFKILIKKIEKMSFVLSR